MTTEKNKVITISRQLASGGAYIGHLIARKLGYKYVEREVLYAAARELGVDIKDISGQDEKKSGFLESMLKSFVFGTPEATYVPNVRSPCMMKICSRRSAASSSRLLKPIIS